MSSTIPENMRSLAISSYRLPSEFEISTIPTPKMTLPNHVIIKVAAAGINPADMQTARGDFKTTIEIPMPFKLGIDVSGTVIAVGAAVNNLKVGDEVFGFLPFPDDTGGMSEYAKTTEDNLVLKPKGISHVEAASLPCVALTALQSFEKAKGGLEGKTVLITSGLGGVGQIACQMAKNVFRAGKVITTVSTDKIGKVDKLLGNGVVDQIVDYRKTDPLKEIPLRSVDFMLDSQHQGLSYASLISKTGGEIISIEGHMSGESIRGLLPNVSLLGVKNFDSVLQRPSSEGIRSIAKWVDEGKLKPVVGKTIKLEDIVGIREVCTQIASGKGSLGKSVIIVS